MQLTMITETVNSLQWPDYDINVWSENGSVYLTFYPLRYPGDKYYPDSDLEHGLPVVDTSNYYSLRINSKTHDYRKRDALDYLRKLVNEDHYEDPDHYHDEWDSYEGMDWWSSVTALKNPPELIEDFMETVPRRIR